MKVTAKEAAEIMGCSLANVHQLLARHKVKTELVYREVEYTCKQRVKTTVFELEDLTERGKS